MNVKMAKCKLSIIIPCYNAGCFIEKTIAMLEAQDISGCEIIVVNDGSQDNTLDIVRNLEEKYDNISVISQKNAGVSASRNIGLKVAIGEYVYFFDSDDKIEEGTLKFYKEIFERKSECEIFAFGYQTSRDGKIEKKYSNCKYNELVMDGKEILEKVYYGKLYMNICACIFKKSFLENYEILFEEGKPIGEDSDFLRKAFVRAKNLYYNSKIVFTYQLRENSATSGNMYTLKTFNSFKFTLDSIANTRDFVNIYAANFFAATRYATHIWGYLRSDLNNIGIEMELKNYKYLLFRKIHFGNYKLTFIILALRIIPLNLLFKTFKTNYPSQR